MEYCMNCGIAMSNYDIDFPVSETWAEFYAAQGLSVDPKVVQRFERAKKKTEDVLIRQNETIIKLLKELIAEYTQKKGLASYTGYRETKQNRKRIDLQWESSDVLTDTK